MMADLCDDAERPGGVLAAPKWVMRCETADACGGLARRGYRAHPSPAGAIRAGDG